MKECLQKNIESAQKIVENPKDGDSYRTWPLRQAKTNLEYTMVSYDELFNQVLETLEKGANSAGQAEEQVQVLLDKEYGETFHILAEARQMISTLTALKEEIDSGRERNDRLQEKEQTRKREEKEK